jgi:hypothetical protein
MTVASLAMVTVIAIKLVMVASLAMVRVPAIKLVTVAVPCHRLAHLVATGICGGGGRAMVGRPSCQPALDAMRTGGPCAACVHPGWLRVAGLSSGTVARPWLAVVVGCGLP